MSGRQDVDVTHPGQTEPHRLFPAADYPLRLQTRGVFGRQAEQILRTRGSAPCRLRPDAFARRFPPS